MWEDNGALQFLAETVHDPVDGLDSAPSIDEGRVQDVQVDYSDGTALEHGMKACQECGEPVRYRDPHVRVTVILNTNSPVGYNYKQPIFCDRACWASWASASGRNSNSSL